MTTSRQRIATLLIDRLDRALSHDELRRARRPLTISGGCQAGTAIANCGGPRHRACDRVDHRSASRHVGAALLEPRSCRVSPCVGHRRCLRRRWRPAPTPRRDRQGQSDQGPGSETIGSLSVTVSADWLDLDDRFRGRGRAVAAVRSGDRGRDHLEGRFARRTHVHQHLERRHVLVELMRALQSAAVHTERILARHRPRRHPRWAPVQTRRLAHHGRRRGMSRGSERAAVRRCRRQRQPTVERSW